MVKLPLRRAALLLVALALASPAPSFAQPPTKTIREELPEAARRNWDAAKDLYGVSDWVGARAEYERAYELSKNPRVLYNIAVCEKNLKHFLKASEILKRALAERSRLPKGDIEAIEAALATLEPFISKLEVVANEPDATLFMDGVELGKTPFSGPIDVDTGSHTFRLVKPGFIDAVKEAVPIISGTVNRLELRLEPAEKKGRVSVVVAGPKTATVLVDGADVGPAPYVGDVTAGRHVIEARADDWVAAKQVVELEHKGSRDVTLVLAPVRREGRLKVLAPAGAIVEIDGKAVGRGAWEGPLPSRAGHMLTVRKEGYYPYTSEIVLGDEQERTVPVELNGTKTWLWWAIGGAIVVGGAIAVTVAALFPPGSSPQPGTLAAGSGGFGPTSFLNPTSLNF
jgi:hypothetical protein